MDNFGGVNSIRHLGGEDLPFIFGSAKFSLNQQRGAPGISWQAEVTADFTQDNIPQIPDKTWIEFTDNDGDSFRLGTAEDRLFFEYAIEGGPTPESPKTVKARFYGSFGASPLVTLP